MHLDTPEEGITLEELFAGRDFDIEAAKDRFAKLMTQEGLPNGDRTMTYNTRLAQELASWVDSCSDRGEIHHALFQAYFAQDINLACIEELIQITGKIGLSEDKAREVLETRSFREIVDSDWQRCHELTVTGVPTFVVGDQRINGAQSYEILEELLVESGAVARDCD